MIWWFWLGTLGVSMIVLFIGSLKSRPKMKDPYKRAYHQLVDYGENCAKELVRK